MAYKIQRTQFKHTNAHIRWAVSGLILDLLAWLTQDPRFMSYRLSQQGRVLWLQAFGSQQRLTLLARLKLNKLKEALLISHLVGKIISPIVLLAKDIDTLKAEGEEETGRYPPPLLEQALPGINLPRSF